MNVSSSVASAAMAGRQSGMMTLHQIRHPRGSVDECCFRELTGQGLHVAAQHEHTEPHLEHDVHDDQADIRVVEDPVVTERPRRGSRRYKRKSGMMIACCGSRLPAVKIRSTRILKRQLNLETANATMDAMSRVMITAGIVDDRCVQIELGQFTLRERVAEVVKRQLRRWRCSRGAACPRTVGGRQYTRPPSGRAMSGP